MNPHFTVIMSVWNLDQTTVQEEKNSAMRYNFINLPYLFILLSGASKAEYQNIKV